MKTICIVFLLVLLTSCAQIHGPKPCVGLMDIENPCGERKPMAHKVYW